MAVTGPIQAPVSFNAVYELDDLVKFLAKVQTDLDSRFELLDGMIGSIEVNDCGLIKFDNIRKMLENSVALCEDLAISLSTFTHGLIERKLIKRNSSLPQMNILRHPGWQKRDSGIASESASLSSETSSEGSSNRLSTYTEVSDAERRNKVNFDLLTPSSSFNILNEQADPSDKPLPNIKQETSKIFFHIIPSDPNTDLSALRTELSIFSTNLLKSHNLEVQLVTSDAFIASAVRHISTSSEGQSSTRSPFKSSNESLSVLALNNLSRMALEHSETSDEDNTRRLSSTDSDSSVRRFTFRPLVQKKSVETQTERKNTRTSV